MLKLKKPNFDGINWESVIQEADELDKKLVAYLARAADILESLNEDMTPQRLAWMIIWTHVFSTIEGTRTAILRNSEYSLHLLERSSIELELLVFAILKPLRESNESNSDANQDVKERLAAYSAWCLWKDISVLERKLERRNIDPVWDDSIRHEIAKDPDRLEKFELLYGQLEMEDPKELNRKRRDHEKQTWESQFQLKKFADHPEIRPWVDKLEANSIKARRRKEKWISSYYSLIGESETSVMNRLNKMGLAFGYSVYEENSLLLHASTFEKLFFRHEETIVPRIKSTSKIIEQLVDGIGSTCNSILVLLAAFKKHL